MKFRYSDFETVKKKFVSKSELAYTGKQNEVLKDLEKIVSTNTRNTPSIIEPIRDYENDNRYFFSILGFPPPHIIEKISHLQQELKKADPRQFYVPAHALHMTIKNIRTICNPPSFTQSDVDKVQKLLNSTIKNFRRIRVFCYGILKLPTSFFIPVYTNKAFNNLVSTLDSELNKVGVPDNKKYISNSIFFSNISTVRYTCNPNAKFFEVLEKNKSLYSEPFYIEEVKLISANIAFSKTSFREFGKYRFGNDDETED